VADTVTCGPALDDVQADVVDAVAADRENTAVAPQG
jgi:hypothetical protein